jgi:multiple sugar transport system substrate-binding protein
MKDDILHAGIPGGAGGQFNLPGTFNNLVMKYSKNQDAAKKFLRWIHSREVYDKWFVSQKGFSVGPTTEWEKHKLWTQDEVMLPFKTAARTGRFAGYEGASTRNAAEVVTKYILTDMLAKAVQGMPAEQAVKAAHAELAKIYAS